MDIGYLTRQTTWDLRQLDPDRPALSLEDEVTWTYGELHAQSNAYANSLLGLGVGKGDRVAILMHNSMEYWALYLGIVKIGAIAVRLNFRLTSAELEFVIGDSGTTVLCLDDGDGLAERIDAVRDRLDVRAYFCLATGERPAVPHWARAWDELAGGSREEPPAERPSDDDAAMLMYTSGTTGRPKGALWTHGNTAWFAAIQAMRWKFGPETVAMVNGPLYHVGGIEDSSIAALATGGHVVIIRSGKFDIRRVLQIAAHHGVTDVFLFPFMIYEMIDLPDLDGLDLSKMKRILSGGDPVLPYAISWLVERYPIEFVQVYGLTEGTPIIAASQGDEALRYPNSVGRPMPFSEISIRDDEGGVLPAGETGEIWTRSPVVCGEYWGRPDATAETFVDGWCRTGDNGYTNEAGLLVVSGRKKDMIRSGGENIYPAELEDVLIRHEAVQDVAVIGVPDPKYNETVCAVIVQAPGKTLTEQEIVEFSREHLAGYKKPRFVVFVSELPRTPSGKIMKFVLREKYQGIPQDTKPLS
ncbi:fatty-acyl-CoA synthase [Antricoccus suffuscus]|uniref:Fatty-acyl-CoA synthase n=1 Tax=Antricoccus suffuscus TaxID=1629062 RepID=A0A2T1A037_9ACTN|nr:AMP-binding protein [Antricoccus suffuscus]PRZ41965.1 fatty-acyl-CoA synthase [Antricoccus suffuscus]